ncbi:MAG: class II SORL domain-containing protein [Deferrisomatales bacterium]|nr:class II SORL domain-containing protein [Deferrisomatales bacterium]
MTKIGDLFKQADWKAEKHVPVIECADAVGKDQVFEVKLAVGAEIAHPNTTEHHIRWIALYFLPEGGKAPFEVAKLDFTAHGESPEGANQGPAFTHHQGSAFLKLQKSGTLVATSYCNIHGLWENAKAVQVS